MGVKLGIVGMGSFVQSFIPCFKNHPLVSEIVISDLNPDKLKLNAEKHGISKTCSSLDDMCGTDVDAIAIFTQNWLHGPQALQVLQAGKHVYSAVPVSTSVDEIRYIIEAVKKTGKIYMLGETSYYYPEVMYIREEFKKGTFGNIVYAETEYYHDWDHGGYEVLKKRGGENWREYANFPPMYYPTHSVSSIVSATGAYATHVSCIGFVDKVDDGIYNETKGLWHNIFSNETALMKMSDGSCMRVNEYRRIGHPGAVRCRIFGTEKSYDNGRLLSKNRENPILDVNEIINVIKNEDIENTVQIQNGFAPIQLDYAKRLPKEFMALPNGHGGSHQLLADEFIKSIYDGKMPANNIWKAAKYNIPGIIAHESALQGGVMLEIPDFGECFYEE